MQNKKTAIAIVVFAIVAFVLVAFFVLHKSSKKSAEQVVEMNDVWSEYSDLQNQFAQDFPCGVTDFDSPYMSPVQCDSEKMQKGAPVQINVNGTTYDEDGNVIEGVAISVNEGEKFYSDVNGNFRQDVEIDSSKKSINLVADREGYAPVRKIFNAEVPNENGNAISIPESRNVAFVMRKVATQKVNLSSVGDTVITSDEYPGLSVTIPAEGLENSKGEIITGEIVGELTYLDPESPEDRPFTPGLEGNDKMMVGIDHNGDQVLIESEGMVFFHLREKGSDEILQPRDGVLITITQPIPDRIYQNMTNPEAIAAAQISEEELREWIALYESFGITEDMSEEERYQILLENDQISVAYWHFNKRTGIWEEWPARTFEIDLENRVYITQVPRFY